MLTPNSEYLPKFGAQHRAANDQKRHKNGQNGQQKKLKYVIMVYIQGVFFDWSPLNLAMFKSLYKIPYSNFFSRILLLGLEHSLI